MSAKKNNSKKHSGRTTRKAPEKRPAKRKVIVSLAEYEAEAQAQAQGENQVQPEPQAAEPVAETKADAAPGEKKKRTSGLDAAVRVLAEVGQPTNCGDMIKIMLEKGYWSTGGKTPAATLYSAILREIQTKGDQARFRKTERGLFELTEAGREAK